MNIAQWGCKGPKLNSVAQYKQYSGVGRVQNSVQLTMTDPGFPEGGHRPRRGGVDSRGSYVLKILYVKTKESGPLGEHAPGMPP